MESRIKAETRRSESSLLLQQECLVPWNSMPGNSLLMPVPVESPNENMSKEPLNETADVTSVNRSSEPIFSPVMSNERCVTNSGSVSQLQQPLMVSSAAHLTVMPPSNIHAQAGHIQETVQPFNQPAVISQLVSSPSCTSESCRAVKDLEKSPLVQHSSTIMHTSVPVVSSIYGQSVPPLKNPAAFSSSQFENCANSIADTFTYQPVQPHWFYKEVIEHKELWYGFSAADSQAIEESYQKAIKTNATDENVIPVIGGRYDVYAHAREKRAVYWNETNHCVRRCTWFYKTEGAQRYVPYDEKTASSIETLYQKCATNRKWQQKLLLDDNEVIMMEDPQTILHYACGLDVWPTVTDTKTNPKIAFRGIPDGAIILLDETKQIDHLLFIVQGIGSFCDLSFRTVYQCVDGFRDIANNLMPSHFKYEIESGIIGRVEFLPLAWHSSLHTDGVGFDRQMKSITLPSIPKLRYFTNDTLLDILLYSSPMYCQAIIDTVTCGLNRLYSLFLSRNPDFKGKVSVAGHSLGSLILFDILANQTSPSHSGILENSNPHDVSLLDVDGRISGQKSVNSSPSHAEAKNPHDTSVETLFEDLGFQDYLQAFLNEKMDLESLMFCDESELKDLGLPLGPRKKLLAVIKERKLQMPLVNPVVQLVDASTDPWEPEAPAAYSAAYSSPSVYPLSAPHTTLSSVTFNRLDFNPACFFALGSPISMFLAVRGFSTISEDFCFPTCPSFYHIFHPYDPVAFRIEPLIDPKFTAKPVLIPHHKGRKRMHLEIRESIAKMGSELKQRLLETLKFTWNHISLFTKNANITSEAVEAEVNKLVEQQINSEIEDESQAFTSEKDAENISIGHLNGGRRIDYVLQEKPIEALNEYIFALTSHATYWNSEDTVLMILREVYAVQGVIAKPSENKEGKGHEFPLSSQSFSSVYSVPAQNNVNYMPDTKLASHASCIQSNVIPVGWTPTPLMTRSPIMSDVASNSTFGNLDCPHLAQSSVASSQPLQPPPLSGFVKKSPFSKA